MNSENSFKELHNRQYSIFDNEESEASALRELHACNYLIFDEEETLNLLMEYEEEFDRLSHEVSFVSLSQTLNTQKLFKPKPADPLKRKADKKQIWAIVNSLLVHQAKVKPKPRVIKKKERAGVFEVKEQPQVFKLNIPSVHLFYIRIPDEGFGKCDVSGTYDPQTGQFIIKEGSIFSLELPAHYRYSAIDIQRRMFLRRFCSRKGNGYYLVRDSVFDSPTYAAKIVKGMLCDGWTEWTDDCGACLKDVYNISK